MKYSHEIVTMFRACLVVVFGEKNLRGSESDYMFKDKMADHYNYLNDRDVYGNIYGTHCRRRCVVVEEDGEICFCCNYKIKLNAVYLEMI